MKDPSNAKLDSQILAELVESAMDAIIVVDWSQNVVLFNRAAEELFGYRSEEVLGSPIDRFIPDRYRESHRALVDQYRDHGMTTRKAGQLNEVHGLCADGREVPLEASLGRMKTDRGGYLSVILRDVSKKRAAEASLRASEERFRQLAHCAPVAIFRTDAQGLVEYVNPKWCESAGLSADAAAGEGWAQALHPDDRESLFSRWVYMVQDKREVIPLAEGRLVSPDGRETWLHGEAVAMTDSTGQITGYLGTLTDLTERFRSEQELRKSERRAHEAEKLASLSTLTAGIVHDIGAPMTAILVYAEMLQKSVSDEKDKRRAGIIVEQVSRVNELTKALLNMARTGDEGFEKVNLELVINQSLDFYSEMFRQRRIEVVRDLQPGLYFRGERNRFQQALLNLVINAADAMKNGGLLSLTSVKTDDEIEVRIADTGEGLTEEALAKVFEPFYTTKQRGQGTGLGLLAAKSLIDQHGGEIRVTSTPGQGTTFVIALPVWNGGNDPSEV